MAEVIVVGAGVVGASVAFHLAERGVQTLLLDREEGTPPIRGEHEYAAPAPH